MKLGMPTRLTLAAAASLLLAAQAHAQNTDVAATPAVQKVSVKGMARFDPDKVEVNTEDGTKLMTEVRSLKNVSWQTIRVTGHTDSIGAEDYNQTLSERRAEAVQAFLVDKGVKPERIRIEGKGETLPVATNKTALGRAMNRRVEIEFLGVQSLAQQQQ
jgi:OOP family OmpA-OmpF porin